MLILHEAPSWRPMAMRDIAGVSALSDRIHPNYPERLSVLQEKHRLYPHGCFALDAGGVIGGYCFSHPWVDAEPPALDTMMINLPDRPEVYFVHDLTLDASMRRRNVAAALVPRLVDTARRESLTRMALVAVNGSAPFWMRMGFAETQNDDVQNATRAKYDDSALHMERMLT